MKWSTIADVPLKAFYRFKNRKNDAFTIDKVSLLYGGVPMQGLAIKAGPAVQIENQWWRPAEMEAVFEVSLDCQNWFPCSGEVPGIDVDKMAASFGRALDGQQKLFEGLANSIEGKNAALTARVEVLETQAARDAAEKDAKPKEAAVADKPKKP